MSFYLPRLIWILLNPVNLLLTLLCLSLVLLLTRWRRAGQRLMTVCVIILVVPSILPIGRALIAVLERQVPPAALPARVDGIVVLGGMVRLDLSGAVGQPVLNANAERLTMFVKLAKRYPQAKLLFTGGSGELFPGDIREADVAAQAIRQYGLDPARVTFESHSRTTYENARLSYDLVAPKPDETWLLITSAAHMPRAVGTFRRAGWHVLPVPTSYLTKDLVAALSPQFDLTDGIDELYIAVREWIGLIAYRLMGRSDSLFPHVAA